MDDPNFLWVNVANISLGILVVALFLFFGCAVCRDIARGLLKRLFHWLHGHNWRHRHV